MRPRFLASWLAAALSSFAMLAHAGEPVANSSTNPSNNPSANPSTNPLSVHVLDLQTGQPSPGVRVELERRVGPAQWKAVGSGVTDEQGRIRALVPAAELSGWRAGEYRVVFRTGEFYAKSHQPTFFPEIPVVIKVDSAAQHYHVPLLLSPFGFSTYRGN